MDKVARLVDRAGRSRRRGFDLPIIDSYEQAAAVARDLAERLAHLPLTERALLVSDVRILEEALRRRAETLRAGMIETSAAIIRLNQNLSATGAYTDSDRLGGRRPS